ncbi:MAG: altronate hydrolase, partial [Verrucomicrobia bacterium]|nr:altronate hydrolase [Verrucomicrobiota bacterium]
YAQPLRDLTDPGFTFMNGPGNDLEGIAGQVAAGCNLILFATGNGSITNFPFVPTLKITTTTRRHQLLIREMDINAGRYLDGESMDALVADSFELVVATASGRKTRGEHAGHSQVSIWRNWRQTDTSRLSALRARTAPDGFPLPAALSDVASPAEAGLAASQPVAATQLLTPALAAAPTLQLFHRADGRFATERLGLILPTSLCSTQVARIAADRLNANRPGDSLGRLRFLGFTHTEGCGFGGETMYHLLHRTYRGYLTHPNVAAALLLEHGCEKVPNDVIRHHLAAAGIPTDQFGWASVQLDGGIDKSLDRIAAWFQEKAFALPVLERTATGLGALSLAVLTAAPVSAATAAALAAIARAILLAGGSVLLAESDPLLAQPGFRDATLGPTAPRATLAYGEPLARPGLHLVASETDHWVENLTGLCGCGAHLALAIVSDHARQGHPMLPVIQAAEVHQRGRLAAADVDLFLGGNAPADAATLTDFLAAVAQQQRLPVATAHGFVDFQLTRGLLGLTT